MIDPEKIFNLFNRADEDPPLKEKAEIADQLMNFRETPVFWVGMFKKLIINSSNARKQIEKIFPKEVAEEFFQVKDLNELFMFTRSWSFISKINLQEPTHKEALKIFNDVDFIVCLRLSISFWEEREEYERCALLKNIENFLNKA
jgi:hypothetical protein